MVLGGSRTTVSGAVGKRSNHYATRSFNKEVNQGYRLIPLKGTKKWHSQKKHSGCHS